MATRTTAPTLVLLVRHGLTPTTGKKLPGRAPGLHLSDAGRQQAEGVAARIAPLGEVAAVYASPLERAKETAAPIAKATGNRVRTLADLHECDFGEWTGKNLSTLYKKKEWKQVQRNPSGFRFPKGESFSEMQVRITDALAQLRARHPGERVVAVSHADPIKAAVAHAMGTHLDLFQRVVVSPCSVSAIALSDDGPLVLAVNAVDDLKRLVPS
jgi:probable phosphoglycerate mutase